MRYLVSWQISHFLRPKYRARRQDALNVLCFDAVRSGRWFVDHSGEPCDVRGLTSVVLPVIKDEPVRRFCSEAIP